MRVEQIVIRSEVGHDDLVRISAEASRFVSDIRFIVSTDGAEHEIDAKSLLGLLVIPCKPGTAIRLTAKGRDEEEALEALSELFDPYKQQL